MPTVEASVTIEQPPEVVAAAFLDPDNHVHWTKDLQRFEIVSREPDLVGSVARLHYLENGRRSVLVDTLEAAIPNEVFRSRVEGDGLQARVETTLRRLEGGTQVTVRWAGSGTVLVSRLLLPFLRGKILRQLEQDLSTFKRLVETRGAHFNG